MSVLARLYNYLTDKAGAVPVEEDKVNAELDMHINLLAGLLSTKRIYVKFNSTLPPVRLDQLGGGKVLDVLKSGTSKVAVDGNGQIQSTITTGTKPLDVASTTKCTGLNVDLIQGVDPATEWVLRQVAGQQIKSALSLIKASTGDSLKIKLDANVFTLERTSDGADMLTFEQIDQATRQVKAPSTTQVTVAYTAAAANDVARYQEMLPDRTNSVLFHFFQSVINVGDILGHFIFSNRFGFKLNKLKIWHTGAAPATDTTMTLQKINSDGSTTDIQDVTLPGGTAARTVVTSSFSDTDILDDTPYRVVVSADGGGSGYTVQGNGTR